MSEDTLRNDQVSFKVDVRRLLRWVFNQLKNQLYRINTYFKYRCRMVVKEETKNSYKVTLSNPTTETSLGTQNSF